MEKKVRSSERVKALVAAFNEGNMDRVMEGFSQDVAVAIPIYRIGEEVGPTAWNVLLFIRNLILAIARSLASIFEGVRFLV